MQGVFVFDSQFLLDVVGTVLVDIQDYELFGLHLGKLSAELASYASAAARNQDGLVLVVGLGSVVHDELLASKQQFLNAEVPESGLGTQVGVGHLGAVVDANLAACTFVEGIEFLALLVVQAGGEDHFLNVQVL